jgi:phospholipase A1
MRPHRLRTRLLIVCATAGALSAGCATAPAPPQACTVAAPSAGAGAAPAPAAEVPVTANPPAPVTAPGAGTEVTAPSAPQVPTPEAKPAAAGRRSLIQPDPDAYDIVSAGRGLSLHKPMFLLPYTYSPAYDGRHTEVLFQFSLKQRLFGIPLYAAYSQKSFWQAYDSHDSSPFRETDYNPEIFYRYIPADRVRWHHLGADFGFEHESNGKSLPDSRSWNRFYASIFQAEADHLIYWKWWYRLPENDKLPPTDPQRDDNPHIGDYYGYSELSYEQQLWGKQLAHLMFRLNPVTGRGAVNLQYTVPNRPADPDFFWMLYLWQGYGEDLLNYNRSIFRIGVGVALAR